jgi:opacity protein-like surface antigen
MTLTKFIRASAVTVGALAVATQVNAADLYSGGGGLKDAPVYAPAPMWSGFYFGTHLGADWSSLQTTRNLWNAGIGDTLPGFGGTDLKSNGAFGGGQLGYNFQTSNFVLGVEVDLGAVGNESRTGYGLTALDATNGWIDKAVAIKFVTDGGFYGDVAGRLGYAWGPALLYGKGGFAWLDTSVKTSARVVDGTVIGTAVTTTYSHSHDITLNGWTVGGGVEYMLSPSWTMKVEYLHFDFNNANETWAFDANNTWHLTDKNLNVDSVKLGVNYLLNRGYAPLK